MGEDTPVAGPPIHPGGVLFDELPELEMSAAELRRELHVPTNRNAQSLAGKRAVTADTALRLGYWLGTGPALWTNLQETYGFRLAEQKSGDEIRRAVVPSNARCSGESSPASCRHRR